MVPYFGIREYWSLAANFAKGYDLDFKLRMFDRFENTGVYFIAGSFFVIVGRIYPFLLIPLLEVALAVYLLAAAREADAMHRYGWRFMNWQAWPGIPEEVVKTDGRRIVALGMYHATIYFLTGFAFSYLILFVL